MKSIAYDFKAERQNQFMALLCQLEILGFNTGCMEVESWSQVTTRLSINLNNEDPDKKIEIVFICEGAFSEKVNYESIVDFDNIKDFLKVCNIWSYSK